MSETNSAINSDWVRLNVGGKVFQTTKDTLSRYPESFLAGLVNSGLPSEKDETGAFLIDRDPKQFRVILNYLRNGVLHMDSNEVAVKELLCEADFYGLHALVDEVSKAVAKPMRTGTNRTEIVIVARDRRKPYIHGKFVNAIGYILMSENRKDYEVLQTLRQKVRIKTDNSFEENIHYIPILDPSSRDDYIWMNIESILRNFGFVREINDNMYGEVQENGEKVLSTQSWKFVRTIHE